MKPLCGAALLLLLCAAVYAQTSCICEKNKRVSNCQLTGGVCRCESVGSGVPVNCNTLTPKCLLMKAEVSGSKSGRREKPKDAFEDTDGLYDPECENTGVFKAKQCNGTTCWCVNTAGVRRTDKHDADLKCNQLVRTIWIIIEMKHAERNTPLNPESLKKFFRDTIASRYLLDGRYISNIVYEEPYITIDLKQNSSENSLVDIADVAYYLEKDVKGDSIFHSSRLNVSFDNEDVRFEKTAVYYVDEIAPEFSMKSLTPGLIAVIVVVV
ncbi:epithelial cell adhesion molecule isoform 2-T2 [Porphyrio hochstetteri]